MVRGTKTGWTRSGKFDGPNQKRDDNRRLRRLHVALDENPYIIDALEEPAELKAEVARLQAAFVASQGKAKVKKDVKRKTQAKVKKEVKQETKAKVKKDVKKEAKQETQAKVQNKVKQEPKE